MSEKKKIAAIVTEYRPRSHADVIVTVFTRLSHRRRIEGPARGDRFALLGPDTRK